MDIHQEMLDTLHFIEINFLFPYFYSQFGMAKLSISNEKLLKAKFSQLKSLFNSERVMITKSIVIKQGFLGKKNSQVIFLIHAHQNIVMGKTVLISRVDLKAKKIVCIQIRNKHFFSLVFLSFASIFIQFQMKKISNWTNQEDQLLIHLYNEVDCYQKWKFISENFKKKGFIKNQIQCRQRYVNKLNPDLRQDKLEASQLRELFQYYDQYGPLWSIFQSLIPGRNQNLLKNKFYSTLRSLARVLIAAAEKNCNQKTNISSTSLSSKLLVQIYEGKKNFRKFKGVFRSILKQMNFDLDLEKVNILDSQTNFEIVQKIKLQIQKSKKQVRKSIKVYRPNTQKKNDSCSLAIDQVQNNAPLQIIYEDTKQRQLQLENKSTPPASALPNSQSFIYNFYVPQFNSLNFFIPYWQPNMLNQDMRLQKQKDIYHN